MSSSGSWLQRQLHRAINTQAADQYLGSTRLRQRLQHLLRLMPYAGQHQAFALPSHLYEKCLQCLDAGAVQVGGFFQAEHYRVHR